MPRKADNHIRVTNETWEELNAKKRPGESFNDVLERLLNESEGGDDEGNPRTAATATAD